MSDPCGRIERLLESRAERDASAVETIRQDLPPELADHAAQCTACRHRLEAERLLAWTLGAPDVPRLSADFTPRLLDRLKREAGRIRRIRRLLGAYWLAAALVTALVLYGSELPGPLPGAAWVPLLLTGAGLFGPVLVFLRRWIRTPGLPERIV